MNKGINREYKRLRKAGWTAKAAFRAAKVRDEFEARDDVRLTIVPDSDMCFSDWLVCEDGLTEQQINELKDTAMDEGFWGVVGEFCDDVDGEEVWVQVDSVWGFLGSGWRDSGYDTDIMESTLAAAAERDERCFAC